MKIEWSRVTWYSKLVAIIVFLLTAGLFFELGSLYGQATGAVNLISPPTPVSPSTQQNPSNGATGTSASNSAPSHASASSGQTQTIQQTEPITITSPTANDDWSFEDQHTIQWSRASGSPGTMMLLNASTNAVVGWIEQQISSADYNFSWNTRDIFVNQTSPSTKVVAPGRYRIGIAFLSPRIPETISSPFSITVPTSTLVIQGATFIPSSTTITAGENLTFVNHDPVSYTLTITGKGTFTVGPSTSQVFNTAVLAPGNYTFYSTAYPSLSLTVTMKQGS